MSCISKKGSNNFKTLKLWISAGATLNPVFKLKLNTG